MTGRRLRMVICVVGLMSPLWACQQTPSVPDDAQLLYYGPVENSRQISGILPIDENDSARQVYLYDETLGRVVAVRTVDGQHKDMSFAWVQGHKYRVYFY
jgi:hypothetical protein